jgi:adenosylcobinamide-GDP ribazoletransferase
MGAFKVFRALMAFLTIISPTKDESFVKTSARFMFLFPAIGALIGLLVGLYSFFTFNFLSLFLRFLNAGFVFLAQGVASVMTLAFLLVLTGLQHVDGLVDVGNALGMRKSSVEDRIMIAHAWIVSRAGAFMAILVSLCTLLFIFLTKPEAIIQSLIVAETSAKLAMVTCAWQGSSAHKGLGSTFIDSMKNRHSLYFVSLVTSLLIGVLLLGLKGVLAVTLGIIVGAVMIVASKKIFGGVTGDIFGATDEIARMIALFALMW